MQPALKKEGALQKISENGLVLYAFPQLNACRELEHGVFSRHGGDSGGPFSSLNVAYGIGDRDEAVFGNRVKIAGCFKGARLVFADQVHGTGVRIVEDVPPSAGGSSSFANAGEADALVTDVPGVSLVIQVADCQAVMLYDPRTRSVANIHAGWRGSANNIIGRAVEVMQARYGSSPADLIAGIGPSLGPCCAEFVNYRMEIPQIYWDCMDENRHFDLWAVSVRQLREAGVRPDRIAVGGLCTRCRTDAFFSYRARRSTGRFAAVIGIRPR